MKISNRFLVLSIALVGVCPPSQADILTFTSVTVVRTAVLADSTYGGCFATLGNVVGSGCLGSSVTFSCSGDFTDKDRAYRMLDQAQMAHSLGKRVNVYVDTTKQQNGMCFANRIDVVN